LLALLPDLSIQQVTSLEPRTPHQPEKLKKLSKNDYVSTPSIFYVNQKSQLVSTRIFNRVQPVHKPMPETGANRQKGFRRVRSGQGFWRFHENELIFSAWLARQTAL
jgi:hypothetical protein